MRIFIDADKEKLGARAAKIVAAGINDAIAKNGTANLIVATGASQFEMLQNLVKAPVDWSKVTAFHLDEYVGMSDSHPASFVKYLKERFQQKLPKPLAAFHFVGGANPDAKAECRRLGDLIQKHPIDVACIGIGENSHIAFNDPPADFTTEEPYIVVNLDDACRRQQLGEGWFKTFDDVPKQAISMGVRQILKSRLIVCSVPDARKADAVKKTVEDAFGPEAPGTALRAHPGCDLFLDEGSAGKLSPIVKAFAIR